MLTECRRNLPTQPRSAADSLPYGGGDASITEPELERAELRFGSKVCEWIA